MEKRSKPVGRGRVSEKKRRKGGKPRYGMSSNLNHQKEGKRVLLEFSRNRAWFISIQRRSDGEA